MVCCPSTEFGPIQNRMQYDRVLGILEDSRRRGGQVLAGGERPAGDGYFLPPTIVTQLPEDARLITEEQFGPVLPVQHFSDVEDAIRRANDTRYGLAASVWSRDLARAHAIALRLEAGTVWINQHRATAANVPFGGIKESGIGRNYSELGLKGNMEARVISVLKSQAAEIHEFEPGQQRGVDCGRLLHRRHVAAIGNDRHEAARNELLHFAMLRRRRPLILLAAEQQRRTGDSRQTARWCPVAAAAPGSARRTPSRCAARTFRRWPRSGRYPAGGPDAPCPRSQFSAIARMPSMRARSSSFRRPWVSRSPASHGASGLKPVSSSAAPRSRAPGLARDLERDASAHRVSNDRERTRIRGQHGARHLGQRIGLSMHRDAEVDAARAQHRALCGPDYLIAHQSGNQHQYPDGSCPQATRIGMIAEDGALWPTK